MYRVNSIFVWIVLVKSGIVQDLSNLLNDYIKPLALSFLSMFIYCYIHPWAPQFFLGTLPTKYDILKVPQSQITLSVTTHSTFHYGETYLYIIFVFPLQDNRTIKIRITCPRCNYGPHPEIIWGLTLSFSSGRRSDCKWTGKWTFKSSAFEWIK